MTNGDKIRSMTDEELVDALFIADEADVRLYPNGFCFDLADAGCDDDCRTCFINYLKQEATE